MRQRRTPISSDDMRRHLRVEGLSYREIGRLYGYHRSVVGKIAADLGMAEGRSMESDEVVYPDDGVWVVAMGGRVFEESGAAVLDTGSLGRLPPRVEYVSGCGNGSEMCAVMGGVEQAAVESSRVATQVAALRDDPRGSVSRFKSDGARFRGPDLGHTAGIDRHARAAA